MIDAVEAITVQLYQLREVLDRLEPAAATAPPRVFGTDLFATLLRLSYSSWISWSEIEPILRICWPTVAYGGRIPTEDVVKSGVEVLHELWHRIAKEDLAGLDKERLMSLELWITQVKTAVEHKRREEKAARRNVVQVPEAVAGKVLPVVVPKPVVRDASTGSSRAGSSSRLLSAATASTSKSLPINTQPSSELAPAAVKPWTAADSAWQTEEYERLEVMANEGRRRRPWHVHASDEEEREVESGSDGEDAWIPEYYIGRSMPKGVVKEALHREEVEEQQYNFERVRTVVKVLKGERYRVGTAIMAYWPDADERVSRMGVVLDRESSKGAWWESQITGTPTPDSYLIKAVPAGASWTYVDTVEVHDPEVAYYVSGYLDMYAGSIFREGTRIVEDADRLAKWLSKETPRELSLLLRWTIAQRKRQHDVVEESVPARSSKRRKW